MHTADHVLTIQPKLSKTPINRRSGRIAALPVAQPAIEDATQSAKKRVKKLVTPPVQPIKRGRKVKYPLNIFGDA